MINALALSALLLLGAAPAARALPAAPSPVAPAGAEAPAPAPAPTVVLVHGAWADGSSWQRVIPLLQARSIRVMIVQNPLTSLADDVAATKRVLATIDGPVVLVGHSWAGAVITEAGNDPKVKALVYVAAFGNAEGETGQALIAGYPQPPALSAVEADSQGFTSLSETGVVRDMAADLPESEARVLFVTQGPLAASTFTDTVTTAAWRTRPSWYVVSADDRVVAPQMQRFFAERMKAHTSELRSGHLSILSHPTEVADVISQAFDAVVAQP